MVYVLSIQKLADQIKDDGTGVVKAPYVSIYVSLCLCADITKEFRNTRLSRDRTFQSLRDAKIDVRKCMDSLYIILNAVLYDTEYICNAKRRDIAHVVMSCVYGEDHLPGTCFA